MALFKISKGLAKNLMANVPYAKEGFAYFTTDDGKLYIDITGDGTSAQAEKGINRICLNSDYADRLKINSNATKAKDNQVARFNGNDGSLQGSDVTIDDEGALVATKIYATDNRVNETTGKTEIADVNTEKYDFGVVGDSYFQGKIDIKGDITLDGEIGGTKITKGNNADILGTTKNNTIFSNQLTLKQGAVFSGSAQEAGLITRGICGVSTPTDDGACEKDNLYINYDGDNSYKASRHVILQAGEVGENYGNNLYQYAAARGDAVHDWALDNFYVKSNIDEKFQTWLELSDALIYQGTIAGGKSSPGNFTFAANRGDVYKVSVAGYINGQPVEVGDLFICNTDITKPASLSNYTTIQANWDIINTNVDGAAFIGTGKTLTDKSLVIANGTKGQLKSSGAVGSATQPFYINNSGVPIAINYTANRLYYPSSTTTFTAGNHYISNDKIQINGTSTPGYNLQVAGTTNLAGETTSKSIVPADNDTYNLGTTKKQWKNIYGKLIGESYEAYLQWGGKNLSSHYSPIDATLNGRLGANRLAGIKPAGVTIEYSNNGGSTWTNYELTNEEKIAIFTTLTCPKSLRIAGPTAAASANSKLRITLDGVDGSIYTQLNKLHIYVSTNYSNNCTVSLESYDYNSSTEWHSVIKDQPITGWTGWNVLNFTLPGSTAFGGTNQNIHQRKIRLTFSNASITSGKEKEGLRIYNIYGYGGMGWTTPSVLASGGVPYTYDSNLMVSFPSYVKSSLFIGNVQGDVTGNADTASKWKTPRTFKIGNCSRTIDGTSDITWPLNEIGVASHNHDSLYVKKTGDTMTGQLAIDKAGYGFRVNNGPTGYIELSRDNGGAQLYGLWDCIKQKWIVQSDGATVCFDGYSIQSNGTKGIVVTNSDYGTTEIGSYLDFHKNGTQDYNGRISCLNDWNFIGKNRLYFQGTTTTTDDSPTTLFIGTKDTTTGFTDYGFIASYAAHSTQGGYGANMLVQSGGNLIIGSGESPSACYSNKVKNQTNENLYITSDNTIYFYTNCNTWAKHTEAVRIDTSGKLWGAVWNDYAECREADTIEPGKCVIEVGDDTLITSTERLMPGANITSDTFGFSIGETEQAKTPIAVSGRVLAYPYESREEFKKNIGRPVCSGPNGTVSIMTDEEYREKGYCAIGTISAVPDYEEWGTGKVKVNGRVWIKVF